MSKYPIHIKPYGQHAVLIEWPERVDENILDDILSFTYSLEDRLDGHWEFIPAYNSLALINQQLVSDFGTIHKKLTDYYAEARDYKAKERYLWKLPVCYDPAFGIDLEEVAKTLKLSVDDLIREHASHEYTVYGIGFLPGFMYLGGLPLSLETSRRSEPRLKVSKGAVGLAAKQTGIYPQESPGGWNIIGNCPIPICNPRAMEPCFVSVGDKIKFEAISMAEYELRKIEAKVGIYQPEKSPLHA